MQVVDEGISAPEEWYLSRGRIVGVMQEEALRKAISSEEYKFKEVTLVDSMQRSEFWSEGLVELTNNAGDVVQCMVVKPNCPVKKGALFLHWLEPEAQNSNKTEFLPYAREIAKLGYISLLPDCFWSTTPEESKRTRNWYQWKTEVENDTLLIVKQTRELLTVNQYLRELSGLGQEEISMVAHDFGAMFGLMLTIYDLRFEKYALMACTPAFSDWFRFGSKLGEDELGEYVRKMDVFTPSYYIDRVAPSPVLLQFSTDDFYVPKEKALAYYERAKEPKMLKWYDAGHGLNEQAIEDSKEWLVG